MSAWGTTGTVQAWANQVEEEEEAGNALGPADRPKPQVPQGPTLGADTGAFPSLGEAAKQPRKKKGKAISLAEFQSGAPAPRQGTYQAPSSRAPPADQIKERLPTGPRERSADDDGRGRSFGGGGLRGGRDFDDEDRAPREDAGPSRADMSDNWGAGRPSAPAGGGSFGASRFGGRSGDGGGFGSGERRSGGFEDSSFGKADTERTWGRRTSDAPERSTSGSEWRGRASDSGMGERRRLNLAPRTLPPPDLPPARRASSPASSASEHTNPGSASLSAAPAAPSGPRANPFGSAKPVDTLRRTVSRQDGGAPQQTAPPASDAGDSGPSADADSKPAAPPAPRAPRANPFGNAKPVDTGPKLAPAPTRAPSTEERPESSRDAASIPESSEDIQPQAAEQASDEKPQSRGASPQGKAQPSPVSKSAGYYAELEDDAEGESGEQTKSVQEADEAAERLAGMRVANGESA